MGASVKVMRSYDYCHFEICKSTDEDLTDDGINQMRKECAYLADLAVNQYIAAKSALNSECRRRYQFDQLRRQVEAIESKAPQDRTPRETAKVKFLRDRDWEAYIKATYDYDHEWEEDWQEEDFNEH